MYNFRQLKMLESTINTIEKGMDIAEACLLLQVETKSYTNIKESLSYEMKL